MILLKILFFPYFIWKSYRDEQKLIANALKELVGLQSQLTKSQMKRAKKIIAKH